MGSHELVRRGLYVHKKLSKTYVMTGVGQTRKLQVLFLIALVAQAISTSVPKTPFQEGEAQGISVAMFREPATKSISSIMDMQDKDTREGNDNVATVIKTEICGETLTRYCVKERNEFARSDRNRDEKLATYSAVWVPPQTLGKQKNQLLKNPNLAPKVQKARENEMVKETIKGIRIPPTPPGQHWSTNANTHKHPLTHMQIVVDIWRKKHFFCEKNVLVLILLDYNLLMRFRL
jgi:hypothetical protein